MELRLTLEQLRGYIYSVIVYVGRNSYEGVSRLHGMGVVLEQLHGYRYSVESVYLKKHI